MAAKLLMKRYAIKDVRWAFNEELLVIFVYLAQVPTWMKQFDEDCDGRLSYKEFKHAILPPKEGEEEEK